MSFLRSFKVEELDPVKIGVDNELMDLLFEVAILGICRSYFEQSVHILGGYMTVRPKSERARIGMGLLAIGAADYQLAIDLLKNDLLKMYPDSPYGKVYLGIAYRGLKKHDEAKKCFDEVIKQNKDAACVTLAKEALAAAA